MEPEQRARMLWLSLFSSEVCFCFDWIRLKSLIIPFWIIILIVHFAGLHWASGGDKSLDEHITLTSEFPFLEQKKNMKNEILDILKKYNPDIFGYSIRTGSANVWEVHYNLFIVLGSFLLHFFVAILKRFYQSVSTFSRPLISTRVFLAPILAVC